MAFIPSISVLYMIVCQRKGQFHVNLTKKNKKENTLQLDMCNKTWQVVAKFACLKVMYTYFSSFSLVEDVLQDNTASGHIILLTLQNEVAVPCLTEYFMFASPCRFNFGTNILSLFLFQPHWINKKNSFACSTDQCRSLIHTDSYVTWCISRSVLCLTLLLLLWTDGWHWCHVQWPAGGDGPPHSGEQWQPDYNT